MITKLATARATAKKTAAPDLAAIVNALPDAVLLVDGNDTVCFVNPAAEQFFDSGAGVLCSRRLADLVPFDSPLIALVAKVRDGRGTLAEYEAEMSLPGNRAHLADIQVAPLAETPGWMLISLRERGIARRLDRRLTHLGAARSVAGLAAALAHEVKNPLSGIRGAAQLIEKGVPPAERELTGLIMEEADRICRLVDRMVAFTDGEPPSREAVNIHEVLAHVRLLAESGFARHLRFVEHYDPSLPPVLGDRDQLVQAFLNLVKNAAEATPASGGEIALGTAFEPGLRYSSPGDGERRGLPLVVSVQDNGDGVPDDLRHHLFEPFVSGRSGGTGLGLALVAKIIGDHGGVIEFEGEPRRTVFRVLLPLHRAGTGEDG